MTWAYLAFMQFLVIWAENLPREIAWYVPRLQTGWQWVGVALVLLQLAVPFLALLFRDVKDQPGAPGRGGRAAAGRHGAGLRSGPCCPRSIRTPCTAGGSQPLADRGHGAAAARRRRHRRGASPRSEGCAMREIAVRPVLWTALAIALVIAVGRGLPCSACCTRPACRRVATGCRPARTSAAARRPACASAPQDELRAGAPAASRPACDSCRLGGPQRASPTSRSTMRWTCCVARRAQEATAMRRLALGACCGSPARAARRAAAGPAAAAAARRSSSSSGVAAAAGRSPCVDDGGAAAPAGRLRRRPARPCCWCRATTAARSCAAS